MKNYEARYFMHESSGVDLDDAITCGAFSLVAICVFLLSLVFSWPTMVKIISLVLSIALFALGSLLRNSICRYDFNYTVILKENCFTIEGKPNATWHAWPLDCTYEFNTREKTVTIYDRIGNHCTYLYNDDFKDFLEEIQKVE